MNGVHCNALVTLLKGAVGLRDPFDSQCLRSAPTSAAFTVQICSDREKLCSQASPPVTGPSSCCDINYRVFLYVPYVRGQGPSFTPVWNLRTLTPVKIRSIYYGSFLHRQHIFRRTVCFSVILYGTFCNLHFCKSSVDTKYCVFSFQSSSAPPDGSIRWFKFVKLGYNCPSQGSIQGAALTEK